MYQWYVDALLRDGLALAECHPMQIVMRITNQLDHELRTVVKLRARVRALLRVEH